MNSKSPVTSSMRLTPISNVSYKSNDIQATIKISSEPKFYCLSDDLGLCIEIDISMYLKY